MPSDVKVPSMYGPVPTGSASVKVTGLTVLQIAFGKMAVPAIASRLLYCELGKVRVTLLPDTLTLDMSRPSRFRAVVCLTRLKVNATSAAVKGVPLFHFTPWRIAKVIALPPSDQV